MNYYEKHIGDYLKDTAHLSLLEHGVYNRLLDVYYTTEKPLPSDVAAVTRLLNARGKDERKAVTDVLTEFFFLGDDGFHQRRCDADISRFQEKSNKAKNSANARWAKEKAESILQDVHANAYANASPPKDANAYPVAMRTHSDGNAPSPQSPDTSPQSLNTSNLPVATAFPEKAASVDLLDGEPETVRNAEVPDCPHKAVLALWAEVMPDLPQHLKWTETRSAHLRSRWRETAVEKRWTDTEAGLAYFRKLFLWVRRSDWLMGKGRQSDPNRKPFVIELEWLLKPQNWAKTIEGKYHEQG